MIIFLRLKTLLSKTKLVFKFIDVWTEDVKMNVVNSGVFSFLQPMFRKYQEWREEFGETYG